MKTRQFIKHDTQLSTLQMFKQRYLNGIPTMSKGSASVAHPVLICQRLAAVFLLLFIIGVGNVWGAENDPHDFAQTISQSQNSCATFDDITIAEQTYPIKSVIITYAYNKSNNPTATVTIGNTEVDTKTFESGTNLTTWKTLTFTPASPIKGAVTISQGAGDPCSSTGKGTIKISNVCLVEGASSGGTTYTVEYADGITGGSVQASSTSGISANTEITLTPTADNGYEFTSWDVYKKGDSSTKVTVTNNKFSMPAYNVVVNATFSCVTPTWSPNLVTETVNYTTGGSATALTVAATANNATVNYQWQTKVGEGAWTNTGSNSSSNTSLTPSTAAAGTTSYRCIATNAATGCSTTATSNVTTVVVSDPTPATITLVNYDGDATTTGYYSGGSFTLPSTNNATCNGKTFVGWSTVAIPTPGSKPNSNYYEKGASVTLGASNIFYAVFAEESGSSNTYSRITSTEDLENNMKFILVAVGSVSANNTTWPYSVMMNSTITSSLLGKKDVTVSSNSVTLTNSDADCVYQLIASSTNYKLKNNSGNYLYRKGDKQVDFTETAANGRDFSITFSGDNALIKCSGQDSILCYNHNVNNSGGWSPKPRFTIYKAVQQAVMIFKQAVSYSNYTTSCVCTPPDHVTVTGRWDRFGGETISLTATAYDDGDNEITTGITGYQWKKLVSSTWTNVTGENVSGATSANLQITNCTKDNSGKYCCVISTGTNCSTASATATDGSEGFGVKVYVLECYTDGTTTYNFTRVGDTDAGTVEVPLSASTSYEFKVVGDNDYYGNTGTVDEDVSNWVMTSGATNLHVNSGLGGTFTFSMDYGTGGNNSTRGIPELSVTYPRKTIYLTPNSDWLSSSAKFAYYYYRKVDETTYGNGWTDFITPNECGMSAEIPQWNGVKVIAVRLKNTTESPGSWDDKWDQTDDLPVTSYNSIVITGWSNSQTYNSNYATPTYAISYDKGTNGTGTRSDETKTCGVDFTLPNTQVFTRNGYTMDGWSINANGSTKDYNLGGSYTTNAAQTFYPHWTEASYTVTLNTNGGTINASNVTSYTYGTGATLPTDVTKSHATFQGWYAASNFSGERVYSIGTSEYGNKEYWAKWEDVTYTVTWKANGGTVKTESVVEGNTATAPTPNPANLATSPDGCVAEFVGWVIEANDPGPFSATPPSSAPVGMFTTTSPAITGNVTFVAIYRQEQ